MAILVSGASGFLGRKLVKRLANMDKEMEFLIMRNLLTYYPDFNQTQVLLMKRRPIQLMKGHWMSTSNWFMQPGLMGQSQLFSYPQFILKPIQHIKTIMMITLKRFQIYFFLMKKLLILIYRCTQNIQMMFQIFRITFTYPERGLRYFHQNLLLRQTVCIRFLSFPLS